MSHFTICTTKINNQAALLRALADLGFKDVEVCQTPQRLVGYLGDVREERADLIIRRKYLTAASNDIAFRRTADGTYQAVISEYDVARGFNAQWLDRLHQRHAYHVTRAEFEAKGFELSEETNENGTVRLLLKRTVITSAPLAMQQQSVESRIGLDGKVSIVVRGMQGSTCVDATRELEKALGGQIVSREMTVEGVFPSVIPTRTRDKVC